MRRVFLTIVCASALTLAACASASTDAKPRAVTPPASANPSVSASATPKDESTSEQPTSPQPSPSRSDGVWEGVGKPVPADARTISTSVTMPDSNLTAWVFTGPGGVRCEIDSEETTLQCIVPRADYACYDAGGPETTHDNCAVTLMDDVPNTRSLYSVTDVSPATFASGSGVPMDEITEGMTWTRGPFACHGTADGLACWNRLSGHGLDLSGKRVIGF